MSEVKTLTLADLRANPDLMKRGLEPGDTYEIKDGVATIQRVFSSGNEEKEMGIVLTEQHIKDDPRLAEKGLEPGDRYLPDQEVFVKTGSDSAWEQFWYGVDETSTFGGNIGDILESFAPIGRFDLFTNDQVFDYVPPEESYGEGFNEADNQTRRSMIRRARERALLDKYGRLFTPDQDSGFRTTGQFGKAIVGDPITYLPFMGPAKTTAQSLGQAAKLFGKRTGVGGALGVGFSLADDYAAGREVDINKALTTGAFSAAGTSALLGVGKGISAVRRKPANKQVNMADKIMAGKMAAGVDVDQALAGTKRDMLNIGGMPLERAMERSGRQIHIPASQKDAQRILTNAAEDQTVSRFYSKKIDEHFGSLSTRIGNISEPILRRLRQFEFDTRVHTTKTIEKIEPFLKSLQSIKGPNKEALSMHLANGRFDQASRMMSTDMQKQFKTVLEVTSKLRDKMKKEGIEVGYVKNHFPRKIKKGSYEKLLKHWGGGKQSEIIKRLQKEVADKNYGAIKDIPKHRRDTLVDQVIRGYGEKIPRNQAQRKRVVDDVSSNILKFYASPEEALQMYVRNSVNDIAKAKLFNKGRKVSDKTGKVLKPWSGSYDPTTLSSILSREMKNISPAKQDELVSLIQSRLKGGEQVPGSVTGAVRDLGYMGTIANHVAAVTQLGDIGVSGALHGFRNTIASMFGTKNVKMVDIGLNDIGQEFADSAKTTKALRGLFKVSGFRAVDRLGKQTSMNAALRKNANLVKTEKGEKAFRKKWDRFYKDDIDDLVADLKDIKKGGKVTELVKFHAFNELSDMQPISMLEMPQKYIDMKNGRIIYALKSFMLKQYDVVRRNVVKEWKEGSKPKAIKNAGLLAGYLAAANVGTGAIKDMLMGRDPELDKIPEKSLWALLGVYGFNKFGIEKYVKDGKLTDWAIDVISPATNVIDAALDTGTSIIQGEEINKYNARAVPLVGPLVYNWLLGGAEEYNEKVEKERWGR
tara:strand:+ start:879 stop:3821 length:2943 start_codon:yes stop_codon:yes gene_type:complete